MLTPLPRLIVESLAVAVGMIVIFFGMHTVCMTLFGDAAMTNHGLLLAQVAAASATFHIACEYAGINDWYCAHRP